VLYNARERGRQITLSFPSPMGDILEEKKKDRKIHILNDPGIFASEEVEVGKREYHKSPGRCFSVDDFLSPVECKYVLSLSLTSLYPFIIFVISMAQYA